MPQLRLRGEDWGTELGSLLYRALAVLAFIVAIWLLGKL